MDWSNMPQICWFNLLKWCNNNLKSVDRLECGNDSIDFWAKKFIYKFGNFKMWLKITQGESADGVKLLYKIKLKYISETNDYFFNDKDNIIFTKIIDMNESNINGFIGFLSKIKDNVDTDNIGKLNIVIKQYQLEQLLDCL